MLTSKDGIPNDQRLNLNTQNETPLNIFWIFSTFIKIYFYWICLFYNDFFIALSWLRSDFQRFQINRFLFWFFNDS